MFATAKPVQKIIGFRPGQLAVSHGCVQIGPGMASPDPGQNGLERRRIAGLAQPIGFLTGNPPR
jgi:hypothetical protein